MIVQLNNRRVAICADAHGNVEVRQDRAGNEDSDAVIAIDRRNAGLAARAILDAAGLYDVQFHRELPGGLCRDFDPIEEPETPATCDSSAKSRPKDPKGAERSRRYRQRKKRDAKRDAVRDGAVTLACRS